MILDIRKKICALAKAKNFVIMAHFYALPEIQAVADVTGDSLELAQKARAMDCDGIVLCGVSFMAESAKILSPEKTVLLPRPDAGCPMADMATKEGLAEMKARYPNAKTLTYVNSSAEIKAMSDACCTSANALAVAKNMPADEIIFCPDNYLGGWIAAQLPEKTFHLYEGYCPVHQEFNVQTLDALTKKTPNAIVLCHPEANEETRAYADRVLSTAQMLRFAKEAKEDTFIILTETGIRYALEKENPGKTFIFPSPDVVCPDMKKIELTDVLRALEQNEHIVTVDEDAREKANKALMMMLRYA